MTNSGRRYGKLSGDQRKRKKIALLKRDGNLCCYCGIKTDLTIEHVIPREYGGNHALSNLKLACEPCNTKRGRETDMRARAIRARKMGFTL